MRKKKEIEREFQTIPGVLDSACWKSDQAEMRQDRCLLYTFRSAVYAVSCPAPKKELLQGWKWK
jgi:hypothetical protein